VDIDLNYIGAEQRDAMLEQRPKVEQAIEAVFSREGLNIRRVPDEHAGGKWRLQYQDATGASGNLEVDLNFMFRVPLWKPGRRDSKIVGQWQAIQIPVIDIHELIAGKLSALVARCQARDLFDCHNILQIPELDTERLRIAFVLYGAMNRKDWRTVAVEDVNFDAHELEQQLVPTLNHNEIAQLRAGVYGTKLVEGCRRVLTAVLPFSESEKKFLDAILDKGEIVPQLLTDDKLLQERIQRHPILLWKALNVQQHKNTHPE
jgi:hypothetical protein